MTYLKYCTLASILALATAVAFQSCSADPVHADNPSALEDALTEAMATEVTLGSRPIGHCRHAGPNDGDEWFRCRRRLRAFAQYFIAAAEEYNGDPWLLAAIARKESGFYPFAQGGVGEGGIMQLHPRNRRNREAAEFVRRSREPAYIRRCRRTVGACQQDVVRRAAQILQLTSQRCDNPRAALNAYNLGARCDARWRYAGRVYEIRNRMMNGGR